VTESQRALAMRIGLTGLVLLLGMVGAVALHYVAEVRDARRDTPDLVAAAFDQFGSELTLDDLSVEREQMLLAVQDPTFRRHRGVDLATPGAGMTTLTQALVKLLYFPDGFRQGVAKIRQTLIAEYALDALVSKDEQLRLFLNIAYLGHEEGRAVHGSADAARTYFGEEFQDLGDDEFLALVAMLVNPNSHKPGTRPSRERLERIRVYLAGDYTPTALLDQEYRAGDSRPGFAARMLMALLRIITDADPESA